MGGKLTLSGIPSIGSITLVPATSPASRLVSGLDCSKIVPVVNVVQLRAVSYNSDRR
jgi:hypothetical protein